MGFSLRRNLAFWVLLVVFFAYGSTGSSSLSAGNSPANCLRIRGGAPRTRKRALEEEEGTRVAADLLKPAKRSRLRDWSGSIETVCALSSNGFTSITAAFRPDRAFHLVSLGPLLGLAGPPFMWSRWAPSPCTPFLKVWRVQVLYEVSSWGAAALDAPWNLVQYIGGVIESPLVSLWASLQGKPAKHGRIRPVP